MANPYRDEILNLVKSNPHQFSYQDIAEKFNIQAEQVRGIARNNPDIFNLFIKTRGPGGIMGGGSSLTKENGVKKTNKTITNEARTEAHIRALHAEKGDISRKYKASQDEMTKLQKALDAALEITQRQPKVYTIKPQGKGKDGEATAVICLSDVHCEEVVPRSKVNGLNEHTPEISKRRVNKFFELALRFLRVDRAETKINNLVLWLGGDFFTNNMHDAPVAMGSVEAAMYAEDMIISGITFLLQNEPNLKLHIVGSVGNHSRQLTQKPVNQASEQEQSFEWFMYHHIKNYFAAEKRVTWTLDNSYHSFVNLYGKVIRFNHGHLGWRFNDGLGGVHGPLWKVISQKWDKQHKADLTVCGHYHTLTPASLARPYIVNGSTIGITPYGMSFGYEPPAQMYFLMHERYGLVGQRPLFVDV
jgi:hypothetical protein